MVFTVAFDQRRGTWAPFRYQSGPPGGTAGGLFMATKRKESRPARRPAGRTPDPMIDLSTWNLSVPEPGQPAQISTQQLNNGYRSRYFRRNADGSLTFWAPVTGGTTAGSSYPRSELRETHRDGRPAFWTYEQSNDQLAAILTVERLPSEQKLIVGQIHSKDEPGSMRDPLLKIRYRKVDGIGRLEAVVRQRPGENDSRSTVLLDDLKPGQRFGYRIDLNKRGLLQVAASRENGDSSTFSQRLDPRWKRQSLYFKAGVYVLDNRGPSSEGGRVTFHWLRGVHR